MGLEELTPARALIAELVRRYSILGIECTNVEVQKLAWFLRWPGGRNAVQRKQKLFTDEWLGLALKRLSDATLAPQPFLSLT
jgi:hypothetical protein